MLRVHRLPGSLIELLETFRPCFTAPTFTTFVLLAAGLVARPTRRAVCGMLAGAGLGGVWHHSRANRFFTAARWSADEVGLVVLRLVTGWLVPAGAPVVIAADDTMLRRSGPKVHAAHWAYDGSRRTAPGSPQLSRGNTFVIAAVVVSLPFLDRPVALPVAARLWRKGGPPRTQLARELIGLIAAAPACRGPAEVAFSDAKTITRAGEARNRVPRAVERTVPFALFTQSIVIIWYNLAGTIPRLSAAAGPRLPGTPPKPARPTST